MLKKGEILKNIEVEDFAFNAGGIAKPVIEGNEKGFVIFISGAIPGDIADIKITKSKKNYAEATAVNIVHPGADRVNPECKFFGYCGGCKQQFLTYEKQAYYKEKQVVDSLEKIGGVSGYTLLPLIPAPAPYFYRNKMEFSFSQKRWLMPGEVDSTDFVNNFFGLGLHVPRFYDKVIDIDKCFLQSELSNDILNFSREYFKSRGITIYNNKEHEGLLRHLVIRQAYNTNGLMINIVTLREDTAIVSFAEALISKFPQITTIVNNINTRKAMVAQGDYEITLFGEGVIYDKIGGCTFRISANSFFQTNTKQAEALYRTAFEFADFTGNETVYDMYSGAGTIALYIAKSVKQVYGFESVESAVKDANINREINSAGNVEFFTADLYKTFLPLVNERNLESPDVVILDPPRNGLHQVTVSDVLSLKPQKIVYVSCNPATQANDIKLLCAQDYSLIKIRPVDMFPQTYHIENVALLLRNN